MSNNVKVLVVGAGSMAKEYCKVLQTMQKEIIVVGRSAKSAVQWNRSVTRLQNKMQKYILLVIEDTMLQHKGH